MVSGEDDFTREQEGDHRQAQWRALLSDGRVVVMDDGRPGAEPASAWVRLAAHLARTGLRVERLWLQFRSHVRADILPANAEGYFFSHSAVGVWGSPDTLRFMLVGALRGGQLVVQKWLVPELVLVEEGARDPATAGECLIRNPHVPPAAPRLG